MPAHLVMLAAACTGMSAAVYSDLPNHAVWDCSGISIHSGSFCGATCQSGYTAAEPSNSSWIAGCTAGAYGVPAPVEGQNVLSCNPLRKCAIKPLIS